MPASFCIMGLRIRYLPRRETLCTDLRILRIWSRVARWGRIRWYRRTTSILRNALITARSRLDHGSRSAVLIVSLCLMLIKIQRAHRIMRQSRFNGQSGGRHDSVRHWLLSSLSSQILSHYSYLRLNPSGSTKPDWTVTSGTKSHNFLMQRTLK